MFRRQQVKTHRRLAREELNESYDHLRMAAAHAAGGAAGVLAPRVDAARRAVKPGLQKAKGVTSGGLDSLRGNAKDAKKLARKGRNKAMGRKETGRRWPMIVGGLLAAGAAVGAVSALMKRRNSDAGWDEYDNTRHSGSMLDTAKSTVDAGVDKVSAAAEAAKDRASDLIGSAKSENKGPDNSRSDFKQQRDEMYGKPSNTTASSSSTTMP